MVGRRVCRVIPSCAANKIRNVYTEPTGITGFKNSDLLETDEACRDFN